MLWFYIFFSLLLQFGLILTESYHRSTMGEYYVEWRALGLCPKEKRGTDEIIIDVHISKKNRKPEIMGTITYKIDFDDSLKVKFNFAVLGTNLAWLPNAYSLTFPRACSDFHNMLGTMWIELLKNQKMPSKCPTPKGVYENKGGFDVNKFLQTSSFPKQFFYGRYKVTSEFLNKNDVLVGCSYFVVDILPIWQKKKNATAE